MQSGLDSLIGLPELKALARIDLLASRKTGEIFPHSLISAPGGLGKSAFIYALANELKYHVVTVEGAALKNRKVIIERLLSAHAESKSEQRVLLLFIDEAHRLSIENQETFYFPLDKNNPRVTTATGTVLFPKFCIMAATTRMDALDQRSFVGRFENVWHMRPYAAHWISDILAQWFYSVKMPVVPSVLKMIAQRSLGTPRQALRLAVKVRNFVLAYNHETVTADICQKVFELENIDPIGLTELHIKYMLELFYAGVPKGLDSVAGKLGQHRDVIAGTIEPILLSLSFIDMSKSGRYLTPRGLEHLQSFHLATKIAG